MTIPALAVSPGRAHGPAAIADDPAALDRVPAGTVVVAPALVWEARPSSFRPARAYIFDRPPAAPAPRPKVPAVAGLEPELFRDREEVEVDGVRGGVRIEGVRETEVVTAFLQAPDGRILLLRRSEKVGSFRGHWAGVSGFLEDPSPLEQAVREVHEEVGFDRDDLDLVRSGRVLAARDGRTVYLVHPFLFAVRRTDVRLDWEHTEADWVVPDELLRRTTVPRLDRTWQAVASDSPPKS